MPGSEPDTGPGTGPGQGPGTEPGQNPGTEPGTGPGQNPQPAPGPNKPNPNEPDPNKPDSNKPDPNKPDPNKPDPNKPGPKGPANDPKDENGDAPNCANKRGISGRATGCDTDSEEEDQSADWQKDPKPVNYYEDKGTAALKYMNRESSTNRQPKTYPNWRDHYYLDEEYRGRSAPGDEGGLTTDYLQTQVNVDGTDDNWKVAGLRSKVAPERQEDEGTTSRNYYSDQHKTVIASHNFKVHDGNPREYQLPNAQLLRQRADELMPNTKFVGTKYVARDEVLGNDAQRYIGQAMDEAGTEPHGWFEFFPERQPHYTDAQNDASVKWFPRLTGLDNVVGIVDVIGDGRNNGLAGKKVTSLKTTRRIGTGPPPNHQKARIIIVMNDPRDPLGPGAGTKRPPPPDPAARPAPKAGT